MASSMIVRDIMTANVKTVRPDTVIQEVVATMNKLNIGSVVVVQGDRPVGIITGRDLISRVVQPCLAPSALKAREVMSTPLVTIDENATVEEAVRLMAQKKIKKLPVMNADNLAGIVTFTDIAFDVPGMLSMLEEVCRPCREERRARTVAH